MIQYNKVSCLQLLLSITMKIETIIEKSFYVIHQIAERKLLCLCVLSVETSFSILEF